MKQFNMRVGLGSILANPATAALVQYSFTGDVDRVAARLSSTFNTTQLVSSLMTVDTSEANSNHRIGTYSITNFSLDIGGYHATMGPYDQAEIIDRLNGLDRFNVTVNTPNGPIMNSLVPSVFEIQLRGPASYLAATHFQQPPRVSLLSRTSISGVWYFGRGRERLRDQ